VKHSNTFSQINILATCWKHRKASRRWTKRCKLSQWIKTWLVHFCHCSDWFLHWPKYILTYYMHWKTTKNICLNK